MAVGFEWQSGWKIYNSTTAPHNDAQKKYFPKNTILVQRLGWKLVTDGADMEFVTEPVVLDLRSQQGLAMDGESNLRAAMRSIKLFCADLDDMRGNAAITRADKPTLFTGFPDPFVIVPFPAGQTLRGFAQVSGGVRLSRLRKFFKEIGTADSQGAKDFLGTYHAAYATTLRKVHLAKAAYQDTSWAAHQPSAKMRSLAELIALYMNQFRAKGGGKAKVVKYMTFIMARTDFGRLFSELEPAEKTHYEANPDLWVRYICTDIMSQVNGFPATGADPDGRLIEYPLNDMDDLPDDQLVTIPITRKQWLRGMVRGEDVLTAAAHPTGGGHLINRRRYQDSFGNHRLRGLGGLGTAMDTLAMDGLADNQGAIFEFRGQQANLDYTAWEDFSVRAYRFLQTVNFGQANQ